MKQREQTRCHNGKYRHGFRSTRNRCSPLLTEQEQDCRDQCTSMADTDPEYESYDHRTPEDWVIHTQ
ncbi:hypothetical protein D3C72_2240830 [compost metagenome]